MTSVPVDKIGVHTAHCCVRHGCKYDNDACPVTTKQAAQQHACEECGSPEWVPSPKIVALRAALAAAESDPSAAWARQMLVQRVQELLATLPEPGPFDENPYYYGAEYDDFGG